MMGRLEEKINPDLKEKLSDMFIDPQLLSDFTNTEPIGKGIKDSFLIYFNFIENGFGENYVKYLLCGLLYQDCGVNS